MAAVDWIPSRACGSTQMTLQQKLYAWTAIAVTVSLLLIWSVVCTGPDPQATGNGTSIHWCGLAKLKQLAAPYNASQLVAVHLQTYADRGPAEHHSPASCAGPSRATHSVQAAQHRDIKVEAIAAHVSTYNRSQWHTGVQVSAAKAEQMLQGAGISRTNRRQRLLIPLLSYRAAELCKVVQSFQANVAHSNPADIFVFSVSNAAEADYKARCGSKLPSRNIFFMALREYWEEPVGSARQPGLWSLPEMGVQYRMMGHWRLLFPFTLADVLGYRYVWQLDDDSEITKPVNTSIVQWMQNNSYVMSARYPTKDIVDVTWGLPELAKTFLVAERHVPVGTLLTEHVNPRGWDGLFTLRGVEEHQKFSAPANQGWDRMILYGNCLLMDLDMWFQPLVQRWIELVINTGYHYRFRWNEQSVLGMTWQMFVPKKRFALLPIPKNGYKHKGVYYD